MLIARVRVAADQRFCVFAGIFVRLSIRRGRKGSRLDMLSSISLHPWFELLDGWSHVFVGDSVCFYLLISLLISLRTELVHSPHKCLLTKIRVGGSSTNLLKAALTLKPHVVVIDLGRILFGLVRDSATDIFSVVLSSCGGAWLEYTGDYLHAA